MSELFTLDNGEAIFLDEYGTVWPNSTDGSPTLVALHGLGGGGYFFAGIAPSLALHGLVFCPDMPGSGFSPRGGRPISFDRFADAVVQLIERKTSGPVTLMGHSMGTIVALKVYARIPDRIGSMIFAGGRSGMLEQAHDRRSMRRGDCDRGSAETCDSPRDHRWGVTMDAEAPGGDCGGWS
jgi:pimeloyl-ACP methyl ester carboxylesterase